MARNHLLGLFGLESLKDQLPKPTKPWSRVHQGVEETANLWSQRFGQLVLEKLYQQKSFLEAEPIVLGSLARGELCPNSDLDFIFLGPHEKVEVFMRWAQEQGLKLRSRVPENPEDLSQGAQVWDHLSLIDGQGLTPFAEKVLEREKIQILNAPRRVKNKWLSQIVSDRKTRQFRSDSLQALLEPQLKNGPGGLRDLYQAKLILKVFPEIEIEDPHVLQLFDYYQNVFLWIRICLHLNGERDLLTNQTQPRLADFFGFRDYQDFMYFVQRGLSRVSFYSDWILERARKPKNIKLKKKIRSGSELSNLLLQDPSVENQYYVRRSLDQFFPEKTKLSNVERKKRVLELKKFFKFSTTPHQWTALFRSRLLDRLVPELKPLVGKVQHDQYHRYTADSHLLQVILETSNLRKSSNKISVLKPWTRMLTEQDWQILLWSSFYHDLAKGRPNDHEILGEKWVLRDLSLLGTTKVIQQEVAWIVRHHLIFSEAAFRKDSFDPKVLSELESAGLDDLRVRRLLVFTCLDIMGTNPKSWTDWKASLLVGLAERLTSKKRKNEQKFLKEFSHLSSSSHQSLLQIAEEIGVKKIQKDLKLLEDKKEQNTFVLFKGKQNRVWLRFYKKKDQKGELSRILGLIFLSGASVLQSFVMTEKKIGIYDWFCLDFSGDGPAFLKRMAIFEKQQSAPAPQVIWEQLKSTPGDLNQVVLLFRGQDQRGMLWSAAQALTDVGAEIRSAVAQTWGEKIEDLFIVKAPTDNPDWLIQLRRKLNLGFS